MAEEVLDALRRLGARMGGAWTKDVTLYGGTLAKPELLAVAERGPAGIAEATRRRLALTYGDKDRGAVSRRVAADPGLSRGDRSRRTRGRARICTRDRRRHDAEDFLLRRTKLHLCWTARARSRTALVFQARA